MVDDKYDDSKGKPIHDEIEKINAELRKRVHVRPGSDPEKEFKLAAEVEPEIAELLKQRVKLHDQLMELAKLVKQPPGGSWAT